MSKKTRTNINLVGAGSAIVPAPKPKKRLSKAMSKGRGVRGAVDANVAARARKTARSGR
tara:strand:+ start:335 stop:511 length:177 start_codon:yes stop_codon:yes gene_type:complete